nr:MAG TPA: hypothetical protein [Caudoviricetes sp.]
MAAAIHGAHSHKNVPMFFTSRLVKSPGLAGVLRLKLFKITKDV